jgi:hypothetical protein
MILMNSFMITNKMAKLTTNPELNKKLFAYIIPYIKTACGDCLPQDKVVFAKKMYEVVDTQLKTYFWENEIFKNKSSKDKDDLYLKLKLIRPSTHGSKVYGNFNNTLSPFESDKVLDKLPHDLVQSLKFLCFCQTNNANH